MHYTIMSQQTRTNKSGHPFDTFIIWLVDPNEPLYNDTTVYGYVDSDGYFFATADIVAEDGSIDDARWYDFTIYGVSSAWADDPKDGDYFLPIVRSMLLQYICKYPDNISGDDAERWLM